MPDIHKARPVNPEDRSPQQCAVCHWHIKPVPGGQGPTWVHTETGAVAAPGADPDAPATRTCRYCGRTIVYDETEGWIDPEAGYDDEDGDGIWRTTCDQHHTFVAEHEPFPERHDEDGKAYLAYFRPRDPMMHFIWTGNNEDPVQVTHGESGEAIDAEFEVAIAQDQDTEDVLVFFKHACDQYAETEQNNG